MSLYERIVKKEEKISLVGLGYVGMPIAVAFAKKVDKVETGLALTLSVTTSTRRKLSSTNQALTLRTR